MLSSCSSHFKSMFCTQSMYYTETTTTQVMSKLCRLCKRCVYEELDNLYSPMSSSRRNVLSNSIKLMPISLFCVFKTFWIFSGYHLGAQMKMDKNSDSETPAKK